MKRLFALLILLVSFAIYSPPDLQVQAASETGTSFVVDMPAHAIAPATFAQDNDVGGVETGVVEETPVVSEDDSNIIISVFSFFYDFVIGKYPKAAAILSTVFALLWLISETIAGSKLAENSIFQLIRRILRIAKNKSPTN